MDRFATYFATYRGPDTGSWSLRSGAIVLALGGGLAGCGNNANNSGPGAAISGQAGPAPVSLVKSFNAQNSTIRKIELNPGSVAKAVDRYRINKKADAGPYQKIGVDLNGDGEAEVLVHLTGENWCAPTGCTLVVFRNGQFGYRAISTIRRVKAPIRVAASENQGWRDLLVQTGGVSGLPEQTVPLKFTGRGYPGNATTIAPVAEGVPIDSVVVIDRQLIPAQPVGTTPISTAPGSTAPVSTIPGVPGIVPSGAPTGAPTEPRPITLQP